MTSRRDLPDRPTGTETGADSGTDRYGAPLYLARYRARPAPGHTPGTAESNGGPQAPSDSGAHLDGQANTNPTEPATPLYLKRFRARSTPADGEDGEAKAPLWKRSTLSVQQALTEDNRNKEIAPPPSAARQLLNDVLLIRHGETQGYSTDSGLTPQGAWQAHSYGHTMARRVKDGETVVLRHAATNRASQTAHHIALGLTDGLAQYEKSVTVVAPEPADEFRNFGFVAPDGIKDVTAAFREYQSLLEGYERVAARDRPKWVVEMDRFWRTQQGGGDPIQHWLTTPLLHFEPPAMCVRRFWAGIMRLSTEFPGARLAVATHSGCIRAFAVNAFGYDPGEPYNTEHVRVKLFDDSHAGGSTGAQGSSGTHSGRSAMVAYRNRAEEVQVPPVEQLPMWQTSETWAGFAMNSEAKEQP